MYMSDVKCWLPVRPQPWPCPYCPCRAEAGAPCPCDLSSPVIYWHLPPCTMLSARNNPTHSDVYLAIFCLAGHYWSDQCSADICPHLGLSSLSTWPLWWMDRVQNTSSMPNPWRAAIGPAQGWLLIATREAGHWLHGSASRFCLQHSG